MGVCTKERKGVTAAVLMATPCTNWGEKRKIFSIGWEIAGKHRSQPSPP